MQLFRVIRVETNMPTKFWCTLKSVIIITVVLSVFDTVGGMLIERLSEIKPWKFHVAVAVPFVLIVGWQCWAMYRGMVRDGNWWQDDDHRRRRRW